MLQNGTVEDKSVIGILGPMEAKDMSIPTSPDVHIAQEGKYEL
jgi:hypothetical protein